MKKKYLILVISLLLIAGAIFTSIGCGSVLENLIGTVVSVETHNLGFTGAVGEEISSQTIWAQCTVITTDLDEEDCSADVTTNKSWLTVSPATITGRETITISVNTDDLTADTYGGTVHVEAWIPSADDEEDVGVTLELTE